MLVLIAVLAALPSSIDHRGDLRVATSADAPPGLETVEGTVEIRGPARLCALREVGGDLRITVADAQVELPRLERVHGTLELTVRSGAVVRLPRLAEVLGSIGVEAEGEASLPALTHHQGGLWLAAAGDVSAIFPKLRSVRATVLVRPRGPMRGLLASLERVGGHLVVDNRTHHPVTGLERLAAIGGDLQLLGGSRAAFPVLAEVGGAVSLHATQMARLDELGPSGLRAGALVLRHNPALEAWPRHISVPGAEVHVTGEQPLR